MGEGRDAIRISEVALHTTSYEPMRDWYTDLLGARPVTETPLPNHPEIIRLAFFRLHVDFPFTQMLALFDVRGDDAAASFYDHDPDENMVELSAANFATLDEYLAFMDSPEFAANPAGIMIDADDYIGRYRTGTPLAELVSLS